MHFKVLEAQKYGGFFIQIYIFCMSGKQCQSYRSHIGAAFVSTFIPPQYFTIFAAKFDESTD